MRIFLFNKLVRSKIPNAMRDEGQSYSSKELTGIELQKQLLIKLKEEADEALMALGNNDELIAEIADIMQVLDDFKNISGVNIQHVAEVQNEKLAKRGGFSEGIYLESVTVEDDSKWTDYYRNQPIKYQEVMQDSNDQITSPSIALGVYEHYKGDRYEVLGVACHSESHEQFVVYRPLYVKNGAPTLWVRPYDMFIEHIKKDGHDVLRFSKLDIS